MLRLVLVLTVLFAGATSVNAADALVVKESPHSVAVTLGRLAKVLESNGITVFARIDHAAGAKKAGFSLKPTQLLIFGNPKLGTPLMQANRHIGAELPLKALAWEDENGKVWLGYTAPSKLKERFGISDKDEVFKKMAGALDKLTGAAIKAN